MITFILAEAELELIPPKIASHPAVVSHSKKQQKKATSLLLDASFHHSAMRKLSDGRRRGRPDIVHIFLLNVLESIANKNGLIKEIIIHTRNDDVIYVNPETRIMRNYTRFIGLMEQLFQKDVITTNDKVLLSLKRQLSLSDLLTMHDKEYRICFSDPGKQVSLFSYYTDLKGQNKNDILCLIGGFPSGYFHSDFKNGIDDEVSIYPEPLTAWTVANEALVSYQHVFSDETVL